MSHFQQGGVSRTQAAGWSIKESLCLPADELLHLGSFPIPTKVTAQAPGGPAPTETHAKQEDGNIIRWPREERASNLVPSTPPQPC